MTGGRVVAQQSIARGPRRVLLALFVLGLGALATTALSGLDPLITLGLALVVVAAAAVEQHGTMAALWTVTAVAAHLVGALVDRPVGASWTMQDALVLAGVPLGLVALSWQAWSMTLSLAGALKTSEVARSKLRRANAELEGSMSRTEAALGRLSAVVENLVDGLVVVRDDGTVELPNRALATLLETETITSSDMLPEALRELIEVCSESGEPGRSELSLPGDRVGLASAAPLRLGQGDRGVVVLVRDVTLDKEIDRMKSDFAATVSHEMRTPMTSVLGFAKLIENQLENRVFPTLDDGDARAWKAVGTVRKNLAILASEGARMTELIDDVLDLSLLDSGQMGFRIAPCDPGELVRAAVAQVGDRLPADGSVRIELGPVDGLPAVRADADKVVDVLCRLLDNAVKFTEAGAVTVSASAEGHEVAFSVRDQGKGIRPAHQEGIFHPFQQVGDVLTDRPSGTGLGLPISRAIVEAHGGAIGVDSDTGQGACFTFTMPRA